MDDYPLIKRFILLESLYSYLSINIRLTLMGYVLYRGYYGFSVCLVGVVGFFSLSGCGLKSYVCGFILVGFC